MLCSTYSLCRNRTTSYSESGTGSCLMQSSQAMLLSLRSSSKMEELIQSHRRDIIGYAYTAQNGPMIWTLIHDRRLAPYYNRDEILYWAIGDNNQRLARFLQAQKR